MEIGWFINHSFNQNIAKHPNIDIENAAAILNIQDHTLYAMKDINAGDEIVIDYNYLQEPEHLKEDFYKVPEGIK